METVGETGTEDAAAEIVFPRGKQNQTFTNASETTFEPISAYPSARAELPDDHRSSRWPGRLQQGGNRERALVLIILIATHIIDIVPSV